MRTEQRERTVIEKYNVYIAKDGTEFAFKDECERYEKKLNGELKECPRCHGKGKINEHAVELFDGGMYGDHQYHTYLESDKCPECNGKGYLEKKVTWE